MDLVLRLMGEDKASDEFKQVRNAVVALGAVIAEFSRQSVKAFMEAEQADRRLALAAKELTGVFKEQASALQETLGVSEETTQAMQAMLLQFGVAPKQVEATTKAIYDFAAATGEDALGATKQLLSGVESGRGAFKEYGVQLELTGKASADVAKATETLAKKFGGAAEGEAGSLSGQIARATAAFGELKEGFGALVSEFLVKTGALEALATVFSKIGQGFSAMLMYSKAFEEAGGAAGLAKSAANSALDMYLPSAVSDGFGLVDRGPGFGAKMDASIASQVMSKAAARNAPRAPMRDTPDRKTKGGGKDGPARKGLRLTEQADTVSDRGALFVEQLGFSIEKVDESDMARALEAERRAMERHNGEMQAEMDKHLAAMEAKSREALMVGTSIGGALVQGITTQLDSLASGGEFDAGAMVLDVLGGILSVGGGIIGTLLGGPAGAALGSSLGGLAASGLRAAAAPRRHGGGWVDAPRYHGGNWVGADEYPTVLQGGERVLSRAEVRRMGGAAGVDAAASGGGGPRPTVVLNVSTMDARSTRDFFEADGGRGFHQAIRSGRGDLPRLLGGK